MSSLCYEMIEINKRNFVMRSATKCFVQYAYCSLFFFSLSIFLFLKKFLQDDTTHSSGKVANNWA